MPLQPLSACDETTLKVWQNDISMDEATLSASKPPEPVLSFPVIGIGASAGGLEAVKAMLAGVEPGSGMAFVVIQHLDPHHESLMAELISRGTQLSVRQARDGDVLEPDHVYVIPPGYELGIEGGTLRLSDFEAPRGLRRPIDSFFVSLAKAQGANAACVILSGTGADGSAGLRTIKERGGIGVAQDPETAAYDGMPAAAIGTGLIDFSLPPRDMVGQLQAYFSRNESRDLRGEAKVVASHVDELCDVISEVTGHDFGGYKRPTMIRRIERRMQLLDVQDAGDYIARVKGDSEECTALFRDLLIHVTSFFRDPEHFELLEEKVVRPLVESGQDEIRVWVAGCSTGEEAYSLAMLFANATRLSKNKPLIQIFASDISEDMLKIAREARYPSAALLDIPEHLRELYTIGLHGQFQIGPRIRDMVRFSAHSLTKDPPFSRLDLVSCRNLLIYLGNEVQKKIFPVLHYAIKPGGTLFLGPSESVTQRNDLFTPLDQKARIFRRNEGAAVYPLTMPLAGGHRLSKSPRPSVTSTVEDFPGRQQQDVFSRTLIDKYAPASVQINADGEIVASYGDLAKYLQIQPSTAPSHLVRSARQGLREAMGPLLRAVAEGGQRQALRDIEVRSEFGTQTIDLVAEPLNDGTTMVVLINVDDFRQQLVDDYAEPEMLGDHASELEEELRSTRFQLRSTVEELETANEELKSSNEEMMSMNEELQSANEELSTVNEELKTKVDEMAVLNADLENFLSSARLPLVIVDENFSIRTFTNEIAGIMPLVESDRGRPLKDVQSNLAEFDFVKEAKDVMVSGIPSETKVETLDRSMSYLARVLPYQAADGSIVGATMTFANITKLTKLQDELAEKGERLSLALSFGQMGVWEYDPETGIAELDDIEADLLDLPRGQTFPVAKIMERIHPDDVERVQASMDRAEREQALYNEQFRIRHDSGEYRLLRGLGRVEKGGKMLGLNFDITEEEQVKADKELLFLEMNHRVKNLFAIVRSIIGQSSKQATSVEDFAAQLRQQVLTLSRAHAYTLNQEADDSDLRLFELLETILKPHDAHDGVSVEGDDISIAASDVTSLGLIFHELATNSCKYGALSSPDGKVDITVEKAGENTQIVWRERGGPRLDRKPNPEGFGTKLVDGSVQQIGGTVERQWNPDGLEMSITLPTERPGT